MLHPFLHRLLGFLLCCVALLSASSKENEPKWIRMNSGHFSVFTDAGEKKGREVILRFEQMRSEFGQLLMKRKINLPKPLDIIAFRNDEEYLAVAPVRQGHPINAVGFFVPGEDRNYVVLDLAAEDSWLDVSHEFGHVLLNYNYPPTPSWFDEGFAGYFSSLRLDDKQAQIGGDPGVPPQSLQNAPVSSGQGGRRSFADLLGSSAWLSIPDLFAQRNDAGVSESNRATLFHAESWIVMHYLLANGELSEAGTYFDLAQNQKLPGEEAMRQAFDMTSAEFEKNVKAYFRALAPRLQVGAGVSGSAIQTFPAPVGPLDVGISVVETTLADAQSQIAEMMVRLPEHQQEGLRIVEGLMRDPKTESDVQHRAVAWVYLEKKQYSQAREELQKGLELDDKDPWTHYYLALTRYREVRSGGKISEGLANSFQDLRIVLDWNPDFAEAYNMLALARLDGGGVNSAMEAMRMAVQLNPRSDLYLLNMSHIQLAGKKWDAAAALLERLKSSPDPQVAATAKRDLEDLPTLKKYGILPQRPPEAAGKEQTAQAPRSTVPPKAENNSDEEGGSEEEERKLAQPAPDKRPVKFVKGRLVAVDCAATPAAVVTVVAGGRFLRLRTQDYRSLTLVGADEFSCDWRNRLVAVNYKAGGKSDGDLVTLELQ